MYIQYAGFTLQTDSRTYTFHVIDPPEEAREFTVNVESKAFRSSALKIQDGPGISMARVKVELDRETREMPAVTTLRIGQRDIQEYVEKTYPKPVRKLGIGFES
jgi:hypothetical protein